MAPAPTVTQLVEEIRSDAATSDPLVQLITAAEMVAAMNDASDSALGFFVDQCRRSGRSWAEISEALGVTKQAAHKRFNAAEPTAELLTDRAQAALFAAGREAVAMGHNYVGTEHLLLGVFDPRGGVAAHVLNELRISRKAVRERVATTVPALPMRSSATPGPYTPRATQCVTRASSEAVALGHEYVGTEHLLLAVAADTDGLAARVLAELGTNYDDLRAGVIKKRSGFDR